MRATTAESDDRFEGTSHRINKAGKTPVFELHPGCAHETKTMQNNFVPGFNFVEVENLMILRSDHLDSILKFRYRGYVGISLVILGLKCEGIEIRADKMKTCPVNHDGVDGPFC